MELLLVSPLGERAILFGRLRGLWGQFLPAFAALLLIGWVFASRLTLAEDLEPTDALFPFVSFITLPVIGLCQSVRRKSFPGAFFATVITAFVLPVVLCFAGAYINDGFVGFLNADASPGFVQRLSGEWDEMPVWVPLLFQLPVALWSGYRLRRDLVKRNFDFSITAA